MDELPSIAWTMLPDYGPWTLVALFVVLIYSGRLVPGRELRKWQEAFAEEQRQKRALMMTVATTRHLAATLPTALERVDQEGDSFP